MSEHKVTLKWERGGAEFSYQKYPRDHTWRFDGGHTMTATAAPAYLGNPVNVDPEEAFVASLASMLTFLSIACKQKFCSIRMRTRQSAIWRKTLTASWRSLELSYALRSRGAATEDPVQKNSIRCITLHMRIVSLQTRSKRT